MMRRTASRQRFGETDFPCGELASRSVGREAAGLDEARAKGE
jgi:hypothetical protein